jgi:hypothetical protein
LIFFDSRDLVDWNKETCVSERVPLMKVLRSFEKILFGLVLGAVPVIFCFLLGWWGSIPFVPEEQISLWAFAGLALGLLVDLLLLRRWLVKAYTLPALAWIGLYLFYSVGLFGFFMGVPVFNLLLAVPAGFFAGAKLAHDRLAETEVRKVVDRTGGFTTAVLALVCLTSAALALADPHTPANLEGLLGLGFAVTLPMLLGVILVGGAGLLAANWWLVKRVTMQVYKSFTIQNQ